MFDDTEKYEEARDGLVILVIRLTTKHPDCRYIYYSQPVMSAYFDNTRPSELWVGQELILSNVETFRKRQKEDEALRCIYVGTPGGSLGDLNGNYERREFEILWSRSLRLFTLGWIGDRVGIPKDRDVLSETTVNLANLLRSVNDSQWASWDRLAYVVKTRFLESVDEGFGRFLSASSVTLRDSQREAVEIIWRDVYRRRREIVQTFIAEMIPEDIASHIRRPSKRMVTEDVRYLLSQAMVEISKSQIAKVVGLNGFNFKDEGRNFLLQLEAALIDSEYDFDVELVLTDGISEFRTGSKEVRIARNQVVRIYLPLRNRDVAVKTLRDCESRLDFFNSSSIALTTDLSHLWDLLVKMGAFKGQL